MPSLTTDRGRLGGPPALLAIIQAARLAGDRELERAARQQLVDHHGIEVTFRRKREVVKDSETAGPGY